MPNPKFFFSNQRGFMPILLVLLAGALVLLAGVWVAQSGVFGPHQSDLTSEASPSGQVASNSASPSSLVQPSSSPVSSHTASPTVASTSTPTPTATPTSTSTPQPTPTPTLTPIPAPTPGVNCSISFGNGTNSISGSNPLNVTLYYGADFATAGNDYVTGVQWDFNGDGNWDTDWALSNGTISHTFTESSTVKMHLRSQNSLTSGICTGTVSVN